MPRSIWNGTITFGLVNVPVKLYSATESKTIHFHLVHARDGSRVENRRICSKEDKEIHLDDFVDAGEIDPVFYEKTYYVGSRDDKDPYRLLHDALRRSGRAGIGRFTFHDREYLVAIRALDEVIAMHTLRFHDEVVSGKDLEVESRGRKPSPQEVRMANQ